MAVIRAFDLTPYLDTSTYADIAPEERAAAAVGDLIKVATDQFAGVTPSNFSLLATIEDIEHDLTPAEMAQTMFYLALTAREFAHYVPERERGEIAERLVGIFVDSDASEVEASRIMAREDQPA